MRKTRKKPPDNAAPDSTDEPGDAAAGEKLLLADIALQGGSYLLRQGIERSLLGRALPQGKALKKASGMGLGGSLVHGAILRLATRSVPGAILVGGGLLAKTLHDRRKARRALAAPKAGDEDGQEA